MNFEKHIVGTLFGITFKLQINLVRIYLFAILSYKPTYLYILWFLSIKFYAFMGRNLKHLLLVLF